MASPTVLIFSVSSSGISILKASSRASTSSTMASESALRSSVNEALGTTLSAGTSSCSTMILLTLSSTLSAIFSPFCVARCVWVVFPGDAAAKLHQKPAVDSQHLPRHVSGARSSEKSHRGGDLLGLANARERDRLQAPGPPRLGQLAGGHVGLDEARRHGVHGHAARRVLARPGH